LWPYLEENTEIRIILFHCFSLKNKTPNNRKELCGFLSNQLEIKFADRFQYFLCDEKNLDNVLIDIQILIKKG
jgi:hypothetical protein